MMVIFDDEASYGFSWPPNENSIRLLDVKLKYVN